VICSERIAGVHSSNRYSGQNFA